MEGPTPPQVLVIGLDPYRVPGPWDPQPVADAIAAATAEFTERGIDAENCLVGLDGKDDHEELLTAALRSRSWDCVLVGGGIRHSDELLELFETTINLVHRLAPDATIAFNSRPDDIVTAVVRRLP
ncbi:hypothetical protein [Luteipulveratus mongoliensis]|uniref:Uncharacterized protein n=1 Tax=Luteipulveratus mongoliensis TaxID=571913 RepID=A0A0K1JMB9_9MICO|nr:hypothetical protein [Luteipulveratus mongoliensis]AKU17720.1 hypothetical protein VV02_20850 [Luteipulveratus mongoliensis]